MSGSRPPTSAPSWSRGSAGSEPQTCPGDLLVTAELAGATATWTVRLDAVDIENVDDDHAVTVYNFHVHTHHSYYVLVSDQPVCVHNAAGYGHVLSAEFRKLPQGRQPCVGLATSVDELRGYFLKWTTGAKAPAASR